MMRTALVVGCVCLACSLTACEKQSESRVRKSDVPAWQGSSGPSAYTANGWKAGDETSWDQQMRSRAQGQNEYSRAAQ